MVGLGVDLGDVRRYVDAQRRRHRRRAWALPRRRVAGPARAGRPRWSSTARAATACAAHGAVAAPPRRPAASTPAAGSPRCPRCGADAGLGAGRRGRRRPTRATCTPPPSSTRSTSWRPWPASGACAAVALRYHNVYGPRLPRDTPYAGVAALFADPGWRRAEAPLVFEDGGQTRDFVHVHDVARANAAALRDRAAGDGEAAGRAAGLQRGQRATASRSSTSPGAWPRRRAARAPQVVGGYRLGDVRHVVASPARAAAELGFAAGSRWPRGWARARSPAEAALARSARARVRARRPAPAGGGR